MSFPYQEEILSLQAFQKAFVHLEADPIYGVSFRQSIEDRLAENHLRLQQEQDPARLLYYLMQESRLVRCFSSQYSDLERRMAQAHAALWQKKDALYHGVMGQLEKEIRNYVELYILHLGGMIMEETTKEKLQHTQKALQHLTQQQYSSIRSKLMKQEGQTEAEPVMLDRIQQEIEKAFNREEIQRVMERSWQTANAQYQREWQRVSKETFANTIAADAQQDQIWPTGDFSRFRASLPAFIRERTTAEKILATGLGAGMASTLGLSLGWHTFAYAFTNVFPPAAIVTVVATTLAALATKDKNRQRRKQELEKELRKYARDWCAELYMQEIAELDQLTISAYLLQAGEELAEGYWQSWRQAILGDLSPEHLTELKQAFEHHDLYVEEAICQLEEELELT